MWERWECFINCSIRRNKEFYSHSSLTLLLCKCHLQCNLLFLLNFCWSVYSVIRAWRIQSARLTIRKLSQIDPYQLFSREKHRACFEFKLSIHPMRILIYFPAPVSNFHLEIIRKQNKRLISIRRDLFVVCFGSVSCLTVDFFASLTSIICGLRNYGDEKLFRPMCKGCNATPFVFY